EGKVNDLLNPADTLVEIDTTNNEITKGILQQSQWSRCLQSSETIILKMHRQEIPGLTRFLVEQDVHVLAIRPKHSLEDYFLSLTTGNQHVAAYEN
ncbi:MAG: ABC transporter ATP-binding protein, partial [Flavisolibacter sp.]